VLGLEFNGEAVDTLAVRPRLGDGEAGLVVQLRERVISQSVHLII
jgi:hypothetical protein